MNKTEIVACIYKHVGRTDDLEKLTEMAKEISRMAADNERQACATLCEEVSGECESWDDGGEYGRIAAGDCARRIRARCT